MLSVLGIAEGKQMEVMQCFVTQQGELDMRFNKPAFTVIFGIYVVFINARNQTLSLR